MFLRITKSEMTVDLFDYDYWVNCLAEFRIQRSNISVPVSIRGGRRAGPFRERGSD